MGKFAFVGGDTPNKFGDLGVVAVPCLADGSLDPASPYVRLKFRLYPTREEAEAALAASEAASAQRKRESDSLAYLAPLSNDGAKNYSRPFDGDAQRFWRD